MRTKSVTLKLSVPVLEDAREFAAELGQSLDTFVDDAVTAHLVDQFDNPGHMLQASTRTLRAIRDSACYAAESIEQVHKGISRRTRAAQPLYYALWSCLDRLNEISRAASDELNRRRKLRKEAA
ncbi:MAG: hypothetical protein LBK99_23835 [Opitutaceae bacterium]|jgi:hypothetical protein|nr:hypothetical protein [Opitutaceae bacterium]